MKIGKHIEIELDRLVDDELAGWWDLDKEREKRIRENIYNDFSSWLVDKFVNEKMER